MSLYPSLAIGEKFCGAGGMSRGVLDAALELGLQIEHQWAIDSNVDACSTYRRNFPHCKKMIQADVRDVAIHDLDPIDVFLFGFPCNDFSQVGESLGLKGNFGPLYEKGIDVLRTHQPVAFIAENVAGLKHARGDRLPLMEAIKAEMIECGYVVSAHLYKLENYGIPQNRHRMFFVGIRKDVDATFCIPPETHASNPVSARQALSKKYAADVKNHEPLKVSDIVVERLKLIQPGENIWEAQARGAIPAHLSIKHSKTDLSHIYRRLHPDRPSYTITANGGGGTFGYHWKEPRPLTNRERARLQTFEDDFVFHGGIASVRKQIGMAVPPRAAYLISMALLESLLRSSHFAPKRREAAIAPIPRMDRVAA